MPYLTPEEEQLLAQQEMAAQQQVQEPPQNYIPGSAYVAPTGVPLEPVSGGGEPVPEPLVPAGTAPPPTAQVAYPTATGAGYQTPSPESQDASYGTTITPDSGYTTSSTSWDRPVQEPVVGSYGGHEAAQTYPATTANGTLGVPEPTPLASPGAGYATEPVGGNDTYTFSESGVPFNPSQVHPQDRFSYTATPYDRKQARPLVPAGTPAPPTGSIQYPTAGLYQQPSDDYGKEVATARVKEPVQISQPTADFLSPTREIASNIANTDVNANRDKLAEMMGLDPSKEAETDYYNQASQRAADWIGDTIPWAGERLASDTGAVGNVLLTGGRNMIAPLLGGGGNIKDLFGPVAESYRDFPAQTAKGLAAILEPYTARDPAEVWRAAEDVFGPPGGAVGRQAQSTFDPIEEPANNARDSVSRGLWENINGINAALDELGGEKDRFVADPQGYVDNARRQQEQAVPDPEMGATNSLDAGLRTTKDIMESGAARQIMAGAQSVQAETQRQAQIARGAALGEKLRGGSDVAAALSAGSALGIPEPQLPALVDAVAGAARQVASDSAEVGSRLDKSGTRQDQGTPEGRVVTPNRLLEPTTNRLGEADIPEPDEDEKPGRWDRIKAGATDLASRAKDAVTPDEPYQGIPNYRLPEPVQAAADQFVANSRDDEVFGLTKSDLLRAAGQGDERTPITTRRQPLPPVEGIPNFRMPDVPEPVKNLADQFVANSRDDEVFGLTKEDVRRAVGLDKSGTRTAPPASRTGRAAAIEPGTYPSTPDSMSTRDISGMMTSEPDTFKAVTQLGQVTLEDGSVKAVVTVKGADHPERGPLIVGVLQGNDVVPVGNDVSDEQFMTLLQSANPYTGSGTVPEPATSDPMSQVFEGGTGTSTSTSTSTTPATTSTGTGTTVPPWTGDSGGSGGGSSWNSDWSGGKRSSGRSGGSSRGSSWGDEAFDGREFTADDFMDAADGDRKKAEFMARAANKKRRSKRGKPTGDSMFGDGFPFGRTTPMRDYILTAIAESKNKGKGKKAA